MATTLSTAPADDTHAADRRAGQQLVLATWFSPAFPVGGFSFSHGLETAIVERTVRDGETLGDWIALLLTSGSGWNDAVLGAAAFRAAVKNESEALRGIADLASAAAASAERHLETVSLGAAFLKAVAAGWPNGDLGRVSALLADRTAYPVAVGIAAAIHGLPLTATVAAMLNGFATSLVSAAVRLVPLGQTTGLEVLAGLQPTVLAVAERGAQSTLDDLGSAAVLSDIAAMRHETLYSRIFRS